MSTYLELVQRLHRETGRSTIAPASVVGANATHLRMFDAIADQWRELQTEIGKDWKWMREPLSASLTAGTSRYTGAALGATNFGRWRPEGEDYYVRCSPVGSSIAWWPVQQMTLDEFKAHRYDVLPNQSTPVAWTVDNDQTLMLWPIPAAAYGIKIDVISAPTELTADADVPDMPEHFHMLLVWAALNDMGIYDAAPEVVERAQQHLSRLRRLLVVDQGRTPHL